MECLKCKTTFAKLEYLKRHSVRNPECDVIVEKLSYSCPTCLEEFKVKQAYDRHIGRKTSCAKEEVCLTCPKCSRDFSDTANPKQDLAKHLKRKTTCAKEEVCFTCPKCSKDFSQATNPKQDLEKHINRKTPCDLHNWGSIFAPTIDMPLRTADKGTLTTFFEWIQSEPMKRSSSGGWPA